MQADHGRSTWQKRKEWQGLLDALRLNEIKTRSDAYNSLFDLRKRGFLPGMGPAYFKKLIFFLHPIQDGFIMDQWTGKSINLLTGQEIIELNGQGLVTNSNVASDYERFCTVIDNLAEKHACPGAKIEGGFFRMEEENPDSGALM